MSDTVSNPHDVGALLAAGLRRERPARSTELRRLVDRYATDHSFRRTATAFAAGQGLDILHVDGLSGVVLAAAAGGPYAPSLTTLRDHLTMPETSDRLIYGMIFAGMAAWCYPSKQALDDPQVRHFTATDVDRLLRTLCDKIRADDMVIEDDLDAAWRAYDSRKSIQLTKKSGRYKTGKDACTMAMIEAAAKLLVEHKLLTESKSADGTLRFTTTDRLRLLVRHHSSQLAYRAIIDSPANPEETGQRPADTAGPGTKAEGADGGSAAAPADVETSSGHALDTADVA